MVYKTAQQRSARKHYLANREKLKARAKKYLYEVALPRNKAYILEFKKTHPCSDCPEKDPVVLQFHHVGSDKEANLGDSAVKGWSLARLIREIAKCIV